MRVLLFQRHTSYRFIADFAEDFRTAGHTAIWIPAAEGPRLPGHLRHFGPDFVFCVGASPAVAKAVAGRVPVVYYELDKILNHELWAGAPAGKQDVVFTTYRDDLAVFRGFGFRHVHYLPFCPNIARGAPTDPEPPADSPNLSERVAFVGSLAGDEDNDYRQLLVKARRSLAAQPDASALFDKLADHLAGILAAQERDLDSLTYRIPELLAAPRPAIVDAAMVRFRLPVPVLAGLLAKEAACRQRKHWLARLPALEVWGPDKPSPDSVVGFTYNGPLDQYNDCRGVFRYAAANLNLQRLYARDGLSDRVFNVLAAKGCLLADHNSALLELFEPGQELETYASPGELREKADRLIVDRGYRERLAANGRRCVEARHLFRHRLIEMIKRLPGPLATTRCAPPRDPQAAATPPTQAPA